MPVQTTIPIQQRQRLLLFNLRTDADDHILGFTTRWINALAPYYRHIDVLTTHAGRIETAENVRVYSAGRESGSGRLWRLMSFYAILSRLLLTNHYDACFAHMQPLFAALAGPLLALRRIPVTTWYTHRERTRQLEWATRFSYRVVSAVPSSFPIATPKLRVLGHGIDTDFFAPAIQPPRDRIVQVARLTPIKHQHILLQAAKQLQSKHLNYEMVLVGDIPDGYDSAYKNQLHELVRELQLEDTVTFAGAQTAEEVVRWYQTSALAVNLSPTGLFDKAALESMACGVPTLVSSEAFAPLTGSWHDLLHVPEPDDVEAVTGRLYDLLTLSSKERQAIGSHLRERVIEQHSMESLVQKLISVMHSGEMD